MYLTGRLGALDTRAPVWHSPQTITHAGNPLHRFALFDLLWSREFRNRLFTGLELLRYFSRSGLRVDSFQSSTPIGPQLPQTIWKVAHSDNVPYKGLPRHDYKRRYVPHTLSPKFPKRNSRTSVTNSHNGYSSSLSHDFEVAGRFSSTEKVKP